MAYTNKGKYVLDPGYQNYSHFSNEELRNDMHGEFWHGTYRHTEAMECIYIGRKYLTLYSSGMTIETLSPADLIITLTI